MGGEEEVGLEIKTVAHTDQEAKAKAQAAATDIMPSTEAPEADGTKQTAGGGGGGGGGGTEKAAKSKAAALASNQSSVDAASMLAQVCERAFMEHQLAACHFTFYTASVSICPWHFPRRLIPETDRSSLCAGVFFVPLNLLIAATSILAFIAGESSVSNEDNATFNIVVGCLAAFGVFWNSCDRMLGYKSRADMHTGAKMVCKELLADLDFALINQVAQRRREEEQRERPSP